MMRTAVVALILGLMTGTVLAQTEHSYQAKWCTGEQEVILQDRTRVDCIQDGYAIEIDFEHKWAECLGQALHYGKMTGLRPMCLLIEKQKEASKLWIYAERVRAFGVRVECLDRSGRTAQC